jgi:chemotaxis protein MotB
MGKEREIPVRIVVRRRGHSQGHHGGAWKVAFADFMTAMFAMFLVMWLINQSSDIKSAVAGYFQDPLGRADEFGSSIMPGEGAQAKPLRPLSTTDVLSLQQDRLRIVSEYLQQRLDRMPDLSAVRGQIELQLTDEGLQIQLLEDSVGVFFETGSATPSARGAALLAVLGAELGKLPYRIRVEGFTDSRPYPGGSRYSNWELSADRANSARRIMSAGGLPDGQIDQVRGWADRALRLPQDPTSPRNRRVAITILLPEPPAAPPASAGAEGAPA